MDNYPLYNSIMCIALLFFNQALGKPRISGQSRQFKFFGIVFAVYFRIREWILSGESLGQSRI